MNEFTLDRFKLGNKMTYCNQTISNLWLKLWYFVLIISWIQSTFTIILSLLKNLIKVTKFVI